MGRFAWRNLMTRPVRTALALIGLSIPILGVMGLFSVSGGLRNMVGDTLSKVEGLLVLRENAFAPAFSNLPATLGDKLRKFPGIREVAPEVWGPAPNIEGRNVLTNFGKGGLASIIESPVIQGQDIEAHRHLKSAIYPRSVRSAKGEGRFLEPSDAGKLNIVISRKIARDYPKANGEPRRANDTIKIGGKVFTIVGLYDTGSMIFDTLIIMDINTARSLLHISKDTVQAYYIETVDPTENDQVAERLMEKESGIEVRSMNQFMNMFGALMGQIDKFLLMTVSLALVVGVVGIINTMLMSTSERFVEFGVLRTNGWSRGNLLTLVTLESAYLGLLSGVVGSVLAIVLVSGINHFASSGGVQLTMPPWLFVLGIGLSIITGTLGGIYPAWRAARLQPMDAIRVGSH